VSGAPGPLGEPRYLLVTTFRRDGTAVPTPVWTVRDGHSLLVWSAAEAGKVKRIRNNPSVRLAPCDMRGKPTGAEVAGTAELLSGAESRAAQRAVTGRYGIVGRLTALGSRLRRGADGGIGIRITVAD
jgi:uncharacterized protein